MQVRNDPEGNAVHWRAAKSTFSGKGSGVGK